MKILTQKKLLEKEVLQKFKFIIIFKYHSLFQVYLANKKENHQEFAIKTFAKESITNQNKGIVRKNLFINFSFFRKV